MTEEHIKRIVCDGCGERVEVGYNQDSDFFSVVIRRPKPFDYPEGYVRPFPGPFGGDKPLRLDVCPSCMRLQPLFHLLADVAPGEPQVGELWWARLATGTTGTAIKGTRKTTYESCLVRIVSKEFDEVVNATAYRVASSVTCPNGPWQRGPLEPVDGRDDAWGRPYNCRRGDLERREDTGRP